MQTRVDVDFSLAMHVRTGKYFIGRHLLDTPDLPIGDQYYWMLRSASVPRGVLRGLLGRAQLWHVKGRTLGGPWRRLPPRTSRRPLLHLDPFTVPTVKLGRRDIVLCHDIGPVTHPDLFGRDVGAIYRCIYETVARTGPHMVFVSQASRDAFLARYPESRLASARVIYPAIRTEIGGRGAAPVAGLAGPFLLTVGSLGDRKNQARCIAAYARSGLWREGVGYVLCGAREPGFARVAAAAAATPGVTILDYVSDAELNWLYGEATGFVLASLLEGFGLPVSEAITRGQVPLVSRDSVLHEVAGNGALVADPFDETDLAAGMRRLAGLDGAERARRLGRLRASNGRFSLPAVQALWREAFAEYAAVD